MKMKDKKHIDNMVERLDKCYTNPNLYEKYVLVILDLSKQYNLFGYAEQKLNKLVMKKKKPMDLPEDILRYVIDEQIKDMDEKELRYIYNEIIKVKKIRR